MLPPQKRNVGKFYHQDEMALYMAASAGCSDVILDELTSPSVMLKKLSVREYVNAADVTYVYKIIHTNTEYRTLHAVSVTPT